MSSQTICVKPSIFREYIGSKSFPDFTDFPHQMINPDIKEFHFILAFARDTYDETTKIGTGIFTPGWNQAVFTAQKIRDLKRMYAGNSVDVKVVVSIGGRGSQYPFNTPETAMDTWLQNAIKSLTPIINDYSFDGIDVNYETIEANEQVFVYCIGELIRRLKDKKSIKVASIAPSERVENFYRQLYQDHRYRGIIDWVGYQFYDQIDPNGQIQPITKAHDLVTAYQGLLDHYPNGKLLAGFSTDPNDAPKTDSLVFLDGCVSLLRNKKLPGIFVWDAEDSWVSVYNTSFLFEIIAQKYLVEYQRT